MIPSLAQGGAERQVLQLMGRLDGERFETDLCTLHDDNFYGALAPGGQPRYRLRQPGALTLKALRRLAAILRDFGEVGGSGKIAAAIKRADSERPFRTAADLRACCSKSLSDHLSIKLLAKIFQALRSR